LAELYQVEPHALVQAVKRNIERFPIDFMFPLSAREFANLKSQVVISSWGGFRRAAPYAFTEQGVAMLSSVLRSDRAIHVNIEIMRAFVRNGGMGTDDDNSCRSEAGRRAWIQGARPRAPQAYLTVRRGARRSATQ